MKKTLLLLLTILAITLTLLMLPSCKQEETHDVVYMVEGQMYSKLTTSGNRVFPLPPEPKREGYIFQGWYFDDTYYLDPYDNTAWENAPLLTDITLYAKWKREGACLECIPGEFSVLIPSTCTEKGIEQATCTECFEIVYRQLEELAEHIPSEEKVIDNEVAPTCAKEGTYDEITICSVCEGELYREEKTREKLPHTPDEAVWEKIHDATCTTEGSYDLVVYCEDCHTELSREGKTIEMKTHSQDTNVCSMCQVDFLTYEFSEELNGYVVTGASVNTYSTIVIPSKYEGKAVRAIAKDAFRNFANLKKVEIPFNVTSIGENAFSGCLALTNITYHGKLTEWQQISIAQGNEPLTKITPYCTNNFTPWMPF